MPITTARIEGWFLFAWLVLSAWLLACALMIQGEYGDGYQTIANARYFFADNPDYYVQRGPLAAIALWPVEVIVQASGIDPFDVRPYHLLSAVVHSAYLAGCWLFLKRTAASATARLLAFMAAILTVVFYAYAPYLSHDLLPGLLFLLQIFLCQRWLKAPTVRDAVLLVVLGAAVTLIKQTYAIFWVALVIYAALALILKWDNQRVTPPKFLGLLALGAMSAMISWISYAFYIEGILPGSPLLTRPLRLIDAISTQYGSELSTLFARDLYLRNLPNYGIAAMLLVIPGLVMALRGTDARQRQIAVCWLVAATVICLIEFREVRYLAFLAPLTAMLIVPVIQKLHAVRAAMPVLLLLVLFDQSRGLSVAIDQLVATARINVSRFVDAASGTGDVHVSRVLSFVYDPSSAFRHDRYHGIYHLTPEMLERLSEGELATETIPDQRELGTLGIQPGDRVYYSNNTMIRRPPWDKDNRPNDMAQFLMVAGDATEVRLVLRNGRYERIPDNGELLLIIPDQQVGQQMPIMFRGAIDIADAASLLGDIEGRDSLSVTAVIIKALCQADQCMY